MATEEEMYECPCCASVFPKREMLQRAEKIESKLVGNKI